MSSLSLLGSHFYSKQEAYHITNIDAIYIDNDH